MKRMTRWQDWIAVAAGLYAVWSPIWTPQIGKSMAVLSVLGVLLLSVGLLNLAAPGMVAMEWIEAIIGALLFISPWVARFTPNLAVSWTAWICGGIGIIVGLWAVQPAMSLHHRGHPQPSH